VFGITQHDEVKTMLFISFEEGQDVDREPRKFEGYVRVSDEATISTIGPIADPDAEQIQEDIAKMLRTLGHKVVIVSTSTL
jgi:hypothetical protein